MAYFAALLVRTATGWAAAEADLDEVDDLGGIADLMRDAADDETVLLLLEQEDTWFGVVRVDGEEDPRVFVSDSAAASRSAYADILVTEAGLGEPDLGDDEDAAASNEASETDDEEDEEEEPTIHQTGPAGDAGVLADFGIDGDELRTLCRDGLLPADALAEIADQLGFVDELEAVR